MKTIGLIGGTTWVSTLEYYKLFNQKTHKFLGKNHSARVILYSVDFEDVLRFKAEGRDDALRKMMLEASNAVDYAGADCLLLGANTMHMMAGFIADRISIPLIHIAEETARVIENHNMKKVALLGTKITMEREFYRQKLSGFGISSITPGETDRDYINSTIFDEFSKEIFSEETRQKYRSIIDKLVKDGAEGIILGCTEIPLLLDQKDFEIPLFNTTDIHAEAAVRFALGNEYPEHKGIE
ncbi:MAG: aspartate/glutamate racemase family protein [Bacteroidales bacterium]|nr:aspartate/glutamate racemase family protein [Bacteroidales bacterium]